MRPRPMEKQVSHGPDIEPDLKSFVLGWDRRGLHKIPLFWGNALA